MTSPPASVTLSAALNVRQGVVGPQFAEVFESAPSEDTNVRATAFASLAPNIRPEKIRPHLIEFNISHSSRISPENWLSSCVLPKQDTGIPVSRWLEKLR